MYHSFSKYRKKGRTVQLLKQSNKGKQGGRKRKKYNVLGSLEEYKKCVEAEEAAGHNP